MRVVPDTNFWMDILKFRIDLSEIYDLLPDSHIFTIKQVIGELERLSSKKDRDSGFAKIALEFVRSKNIRMIPSPDCAADKALLDLSDKETVIATDDSALKRKIKAGGGKTIYILGKKHIALS